MTRKVIETDMARKFTVERLDENVFLYVENTSNNIGSPSRINSRMDQGHAEELGTTLIEKAGKRAHLFEGKLPVVNLSSYYISAGEGDSFIRRDVTNTSENIAEQIKSLISIHKYLLKEEAEKAAQQKAAEEAMAALEAKLKEQEAALEKRRDALARQFDRNIFSRYQSLDITARNAIDFIINKEADK
ncbi:hypothetical protein SEA_ATUIN_251 [Arthrobacter phage Atuin]|nr:hypothetical protein SEA_ATUIN_50 [Arthrobacter phage Atuin]